MKAGRIVALVLGILGVLVGAALISGGIAGLVEDRDDDGFYAAEEHRFQRSGYAIVSEDIDVLSDAPSWLVDLLADPVDFRMQGTTTGGGLFLGIARTADVETFLAGVNHDEVTDLTFDGDTITDVEYLSHPGSTVPATPGSQGFWDASTEGAGPQTLDWSLEPGTWTAVVMNADGSAGVDADLIFGIKISNLTTIAWITMLVGLVSVFGGVFLARLAFRRPPEPEPTRRATGVDVVDIPKLDAPTEQEPTVKS